MDRYLRQLIPRVLHAESSAFSQPQMDAPPFLSEANVPQRRSRSTGRGGRHSVNLVESTAEAVKIPRTDLRHGGTSH